MELKDIHEKKNLVFDRKEMKGTLISESAPSTKDVATLLAKKFSVPQEAIKVKGIYGRFGLKEFKVEAHIYKSKEEKDKVEKKTKKEIEGEKKEAEAAKAAKEEKGE